MVVAAVDNVKFVAVDNVVVAAVDNVKFVAVDNLLLLLTM